jgi:predicted Zn-dependent protease
MGPGDRARLFTFTLALTASAGCIMSVDVLQLAEEAKRKKRSGHAADLCARTGMVGRAQEQLAGTAGSGHEGPARQAIQNARLRFGVAPSSPRLAGPDEADRARAWWEAREALDAEQVPRAEAALKPVLQRFRDDPGLLALSCEISVRRSGTGKDPGGSCERAVKLWEDLPRGLFWSALAQANNGNRRLAVTRLVRAKSLDPSFEGPWKVLADIYRFEGRNPELAALRSEYQSQFGKPMR